MGGGLADEVFLVGAMKVNIPLVSVCDASFATFEAEDSREHIVLFAGLVGCPDPRGFSALKDGAFWGLSSVFFADAKGSEWSAVGAFFASQAKLGGRGGEGEQKLPMLKESYLLLGYGDVEGLHLGVLTPRS